MKDAATIMPADHHLGKDEERLIGLRRELKRAMRECLPDSFFRITPEEEHTAWLDLLLMYRLTGSAITSRADTEIFRINALHRDSIVRNLSTLRNEEILDASIFHSRSPLWEGGPRIELSKFVVSKGIAPVVRGNVEEMGLAIEEIVELFNTFHGQPSTREEVVGHLNQFNPSFLRNASAERLAATLDLYLRVKGTDSLLVSTASLHRLASPEVGINRILLGSCDVPRRGFILKAARVFARMNLVLHRVNVTTVYPPDGGAPVGLSAYYASDPQHVPLIEGSQEFERLIDELRVIKWVPDEDRLSRLVGRVDEVEKPTSQEAHLLRFFANFLHQLFTGLPGTRYDLEDIEQIYLERPGLAGRLIHLFHLKFDPWRRNPEQFTRLKWQLKDDLTELSTGIFEEDQRIRRVFLESVRFIDCTRKVNYYLKERAALAALLDPEILKIEGGTETFDPLPEHVYFVFGLGFRGYHFSFSSFVRGGLRTLLPPTGLKYRYDLQGALRECYDLAHTQHLKNKDIPEGGAKGLLVVRPGVGKELSQRIFVRELIALMVAEEEPERAPEMVASGNPGPLVFLGPDENMSDSMIEWIDAYSRNRGVMAGGALMSGHPATGINHKHFGVTSRGVHTYLKRILSYKGMDPSNMSFRVKFSGGPDGDVAGNCIKLLCAEFPQTAKIVSIVDGTGFGYDPEGFDHTTLLELVQTGKGIAAFPAECLHPGARLLEYRQVGARTSVLVEQLGDRIGRRELSSNEANRMHLNDWYPIEAEVFLPCGGRPNTLNEETWEGFLIEGKPSAPIIIEGANLFISPAARTELEMKGVLLVRDSSANKCGVIASSYEVLGMLLLGEEVFGARVKELVPELLSLLEDRAALEAEWLLSRHKASDGGVSLVELSARLSQFMQERKFAALTELAPHFDRLNERMERGISPVEMAPPLRRFASAFERYVPDAFLDIVPVNRCWSRLRSEHAKAIIAAQSALDAVRKDAHSE